MEASKVGRLFASLVLVSLAGFCLFGFLATYEPVDPASAARWRLVWGTVGGLSVLGLLGTLRGLRRSSRRGR